MNRTNYSPSAVDAAIAASNRFGQKVSRREAKMIHALLKGRTMDRDDLHAHLND